MKNHSHLLKSRRFMPLFITQFLGAFNDNVFKNSIIILITYVIAERAGYNAQVMVTLAAGVFILPFFLFSALAGQLADKYEKSKIIRKIKFAEVILMLLAVLGFYLENIPVLMSVLFLTGVQAAFFGPVKYSILPDHLSEAELLNGNGLIEAGTFVAILLGTILGGVLILKNHGVTEISCILVLVALIGWLVSWLIPETPNSNIDLKINKNFLTESWKVIRELTEKRDIFLSALGISWIWLIGATFLSEFPTLAKDVIGGNEQVVTLFLAMFSIGIAVGSLICNKLLKGRINAQYLPVSSLFITIFSFDLFLAGQNVSNSHPIALANILTFLGMSSSWRILFDLLMISIASGIYIVPLYAIIQTHSEPKRRSRMIAANNILNALFMTAAAVVTAILFAIHVSVNQIFLLVSITNIFVFFYICKLLSKALIKSILRAFLKFAYRTEIVGLENFYDVKKNAVIVANHTSFLDAILLAAFLPDNITYAINTMIFNQWWIKPFLFLIDAFPIDPTKPMATKSLIEHVKKGNNVLIFPEGRLTVTGTLMKIYEGPGMIADKSQSCLLPIRIDGAVYTPFSRMKGKVRIHLFPKIKITVLPVHNFSIPSNFTGRQRRQLIGLKLHDLMVEMMFVTSDAKRTLFQSLLDARSIHGKRHIIAEDISGSRLHYNQLIIRSFILGHKIAKTTAQHEYVGLLLPNMTGTVVSFFAMQAFHRVPVMLNFSTGLNNVVLACETAKLRFVYTSRKFIEEAKLTALVDAIRAKGMKIIYLEDLARAISFLAKIKGRMIISIAEFYYRTINNINKKRMELASQTPAVVLFTSGSEGVPKGVVLSHHNIQSNRFQLSGSVDFGANDKIFNALPLFHSFGLTAGTLLPILSGMKTFFYPSPLHYRVIPELIYATNSTILFGTDTFLANYAKFAHAYDFYSVRYVFAGAEKLKENTRKLLIEKLGIRVLEGYGVTETSPILAINTPMQNRIGTVGRLMPGITFKVEPVPNINEGGKLLVKGPNVMLGYLFLDKPGELHPPKDGWHDTGDIIDMDAQGYITIKGRAKRFAKVAGEMVSLAAVENAISVLWPLHQHAVISIPDPKKGEQITLVTNNSEIQRDELISYFKEQGLADISVPKAILSVEKIPLLNTGKIDYVTVGRLVDEWKAEVIN